MGRDYPLGYEYFRQKTHNAFMRNKDIKDPKKIEELLKFGDYIVNEIKAMYSLRKYRTLKRRYYTEEDSSLPKDPSSY